PSLGRTAVGNDRVSSLRVELDSSACTPAPTREPPGPEGVTLFEHDGYSGRSENFQASDSNLKDNLIGNDRASSIRVPPGYVVTLYKNANFRGRSVVLRGDVPALGRTAVGNDQVSSLRVERIP
ncbi:MAG: beta/gamma crystallin-related protein, partial [Candidatus Acidiferrales bacterium]